MRNIELTEFGKDIELTIADFSGNNAVEHFMKVFNNGMREVLDKHAPSQTKEIILRPNSPWYSEELRVAKRERRKAERVWRRTNLTIHRDIHKDKCHLYSKLLTQSKQDYFSRKNNECGSDSKRLYGLTNRLLGKNQEPSLPTSDSDTEMSNKFSEFFVGKIQSIRTSLQDANQASDIESDVLEFLVDNIFVVFGGKVFQQIVGIPMGTNCAPLLADIFLYSYEAEFIQSLLSTGKKKLASQFNFTYRYIDDVLSINNPDFENYLGQMYPAELEIKDTTESNTSASYLDLLLSIESDGQLRTSLYDKRDDFTFHITNSPFLSSNIPSSPAYGVFISQLIRYARACSSYECFILRAARLSSKLLRQGYVMERLKSSLRKFYGRYGDLIKHYEVSLSQMLHDILGHDHI